VFKYTERTQVGDGRTRSVLAPLACAEWGCAIMLGEKNHAALSHSDAAIAPNHPSICTTLFQLRSCLVSAVPPVAAGTIFGALD
jgi:hypothetical protein